MSFKQRYSWLVQLLDQADDNAKVILQEELAKPPYLGMYVFARHQHSKEVPVDLVEKLTTYDIRAYCTMLENLSPEKNKD